MHASKMPDVIHVSCYTHTSTYFHGENERRQRGFELRHPATQKVLVAVLAKAIAGAASAHLDKRKRDREEKKRGSGADDGGGGPGDPADGDVVRARGRRRGGRSSAASGRRSPG